LLLGKAHVFMVVKPGIRFLRGFPYRTKKVAMAAKKATKALGDANELAPLFFWFVLALAVAAGAADAEDGSEVEGAEAGAALLRAAPTS